VQLCTLFIGSLTHVFTVNKAQLQATPPTFRVEQHVVPKLVQSSTRRHAQASAAHKLIMDALDLEELYKSHGSAARYVKPLASLLKFGHSVCVAQHAAGWP